MKRAIAVRLLTGLIAFTALAAFAGSAAWFIPTASIDPDNTPIEGETMGAYFAYGDGTPEHPYGITKPRHVYNLAWLQYLGMFNNVNKSTSPNYNRQFRFEVAADVDMGGLVIPPIGTTEFPFVGELQGKDHIISNFSVSNSFADLKVHPAAINSGNFKNNVVKIVGFFGVVGNYENQFSGQGIVYNNAINTINDLGLTNFTVTTVASDTLIGMAAGWVGGTTNNNIATINNIAVDTGTINVEAANAAAFNGGSITNRLSDYSIVGYSASKQKLHRYSDTVYNVSTTILPDSFTVDEQSSSAGWGGSLDMVQMYNDLFSVWDTFSGASGTNRQGKKGFYTYVTSRVIECHNGIETNREETTSEFSAGLSNGTYNYFGKTVEDAEGHTTSSYNFVIETSSTQPYSRESRYMCLDGERTIDVGSTTNETIYNTTDPSVGFYIVKDGNYLTNDAGFIVTTTSPAAGSVWRWYAGTNNSYLYSDYDHSSYYLSNNAGTLELDTTRYTTWTWNAGSNRLTSTAGDTTYYLGCVAGTWKLSTSTSATETYYTIVDGNNHYLNVNAAGSGYAVGNSANTATHWQRDGSRYYTNAGGQKKYISYTNTTTSGSGTLALNANTTYAMTHEAAGTGTRYYLQGNFSSGWFTTYYVYLRYNNGWVQYTARNNQTNARNNGTVLTITEQSETVNYACAMESAPVIITQNAPDASFKTNPTYFPLKHTNGIPEPDNTGYLVSGTNYKGDVWSDIRVSKYAATGDDGHNLQNSVTDTSTNALTTVYTISGNNARSTLPTNLNNKDAATEAKYPRYYKALKNMNKALGKDTSNIYGLHFMSAQIGGSDRSQRVNVGAATINGEGPMLNYPLPTDCIDFNLKDRGAITFFAGTYFINNGTAEGKKNNSFFSLWDLNRDPNTRAVSIKEITEIFKHNTNESAEYIYKYSDGTYSSASYSSSSYTSIFNTNWIKRQSSVGEDSSAVYRYYSAYYFEIPMNPGEYALGSVDGGTGAYLMYLDIGANAQTLNRTIFGEHYEQTETVFEYPLGVEYVATENMSSKLTSGTIAGENSACASVYANFSGSFSMTRTGSSDGGVVTMGKYPSETLKGTYVYDQISMHDPGGRNVTSVALETYSTRIYRTQYYDYDAIREQTTRTIITRTIKSGVDDYGAAIGSATDVKTYSQQQQENPTAAWTDVAESMWVLYKSEDGTPYGATDAKPLGDLAAAPMQDAGALVILVYGYTTRGTVTASEVQTLLTALDAQNAKYDVNGYTVEVKSSDSNRVTINVKDPEDTTKVTISVVEGEGGVKTVTVTVIGDPNTVYTFTITPTVTA